MTAQTKLASKQIIHAMETEYSHPPPRKRLLVIHNPTAGWLKTRRLERVTAALRAMGCLVELRRTSQRGDAERIARTALGGAWDCVVVAGGDGTINEAVNGLTGEPGGSQAAPPLAIVPMGTANVLAAEIGLGADPARIARTIAFGPARPVALGAVDGRRFVMMAGIGFDAEVVRLVDPRWKRLLGKLAYVLATLDLLLRFRRQALKVTAGGRDYPAGAVVVANGRHYAGRFVCARSAGLDRPELALCLFRADSRLAILRYALALATGRLDRLGDVTVLSAKDAVIEGAGDGSMDDAPIQADGDLLGRLPARVAVLPQALSLVVPPDSPLGSPLAA
jgi:YegS/Rv2252/BmrU family lipid kinase